MPRAPMLTLGWTCSGDTGAYATERAKERAMKVQLSCQGLPSLSDVANAVLTCIAGHQHKTLPVDRDAQRGVESAQYPDHAGGTVVNDDGEHRSAWSWPSTMCVRKEVLHMKTSVYLTEGEREVTGERVSREERMEQYALAKILWIWTLATVPMGILGWIVAPFLAPDGKSDPLGAGVARLVLLMLGLIWQFVLSMILVRREEGNVRWATVKRRLRLTAPRATTTGEPGPSLWWWLVPFLGAIALVELVLASSIESVWVSVLPFLAEPPGYSFDAIFSSQAILERLAGAWWFLVLFVLQAAFNTFLGEELLFRGVLLPKMEGVFGRWSWVANSVLFGLYHVHQPWRIPSSVLTGLLYTFPAYRFRSTWFAIVLHSAQSVYFAILVLGVVLGLG